MRSRIKKTLAVVLAAVLGALCALPAGAAVSMPAGFTEQQVEESIPKADVLVKALLQSSDALPDPKQTVYGMLYADETLSSLFSSIYEAFDENRSTLSTLGVDFSVPRVAAALQGFPEVYAVLNGQTDWPAVLPGVKDFRWNVHDRAAFAAALSGMLVPLNDLLFTLLCAGSYQVNRLVSVTGANGYENAIVPLLQAVGCPSVLTQAAFTADAQAGRYAMVKNLVFMLLDALDNMLAAPVQSFCTYLPGIAYYLKNGGLTETLRTLMEPLKLKIAIFTLPGISKLLENTDLFSSGMDLTAMLSQADLGAMTGSDVQMKLPEIDLDALAACGTVQNGRLVPNKAQAFITILYWFFDAVKLNAGSLPSEFSSFSSLFQKDNAFLAGIILKILTWNGEAQTSNYVWSYPAHTAGTAAEVQGLSRENIERMLGMIDDTLNEFLVEFTDMGELSALIKKAVYSNRFVTILATGVYGAFDLQDGVSLGSLLGIATSTSEVADAVRRSYPAAARRISAYGNWEKVPVDAVSWGFADGSKEGFVNAVTAVLQPLAPILRFLLAEGSFRLFDAITLGGSNGYNTAVIPLLEGVGCAPENILSYADYKKSSDTALISSLLAPLTALLDDLSAKPVGTLCAILPQLAYFLSSEQPSQCMKNLLYPITQPLAELGLSELLPDTLSDLSALDPEKLLSTATEGLDLGIKLPNPDLKLLASLGSAETQESKRTENGAPAQVTRIVADQPSVLITLLRYVIDGVKAGGGLALPEGFSMGNAAEAENGMDMMSVYSEKVSAELQEKTTDETIVWLYDLLFAETPKKETEEHDGYIPTIIYEETPDHTARNRGILAFLILALFIGLVCFFAKYDFAQARARRKRKRDKRKRRLQTAGVPANTAPPRTAGSAAQAPTKTAVSAKDRRRAWRATKKADKHYEKARRA